jgi:hypothetical protein
MALTVVNEGAQLLLEYSLNKTTAADVKLHLYSNDVTIDDSSEYSDFTLITNPAAKTLSGSSWDTTDTVGTASYAEQTFTFSGSATVYGYVVINGAGNTVLWAEEFDDGPYSIPSGGGDIKITPTISAD